MRLIIGVTLAAMAAWCIWWFTAASALEDRWRAWLEAQRARGWVAEAGETSVGGFPYRFDTALTGLTLADPQSGWAWSADRFHLLRLAYEPNHFIAEWPGRQIIASPWQKTEITSEIMRGSAVFTGGDAPALNTAQMEAKSALFKTGDGSARLAAFNLASRALPPEAAPGHAHQIGLDMRDLTLSDPLHRALNPTGLMPKTLQRVQLDATMVFSAPWTMNALEAGAPRIEQINLRALDLGAGQFQLSASGQLDVDRAGYPEGTLNLEVRNPQELLDMASRTGAISTDIARALSGALALLQTLSGGGDTLSVPLNFSGGRAHLGPVPIGKAPLLAWP